MGARVIELLLNNPGVDLFSRLPSSTFSVIWCAGYSQRVIPVLSNMRYILKWEFLSYPAVYQLFSSGDNFRPVIFLRLWRRPLCRRAHHPRRGQESWLQSGSGGDEDGDEDGAAALEDDNEHEDVQITSTKWQVEVTDDLSTWHQADGQTKGTFLIFT